MYISIELVEWEHSKYAVNPMEQLRNIANSVNNITCVSLISSNRLSSDSRVAGDEQGEWVIENFAYGYI